VNTKLNFFKAKVELVYVTTYTQFPIPLPPHPNDPLSDYFLMASPFQSQRDLVCGKLINATIYT